MENNSRHQLYRLSLIEVLVGIVFFIILSVSGLFGLFIMYLTPILTFAFILAFVAKGEKYKWKPVGWIALVVVNTVLTFYFSWYFWINDPINHSAWH
ncbi:MAG: hypothetical protein ABW092_08655 [Candidatus Thiodiazotropha sp.]